MFSGELGEVGVLPPLLRFLGTLPEDDATSLAAAAGTAWPECCSSAEMVWWELGTSASLWGSNHGKIFSSSAAKAGVDFAAWFTIDSKVPPACCFSHVPYLLELFPAAASTAAAVPGLGKPRLCMARWPFSHVSSATSYCRSLQTH